MIETMSLHVLNIYESKEQDTRAAHARINPASFIRTYIEPWMNNYAMSFQSVA